MRLKDLALHLALALFVLAPLGSALVPGSFNDDLANHVRFVFEASQAFREGQGLPLTTVDLNRGMRDPVFQFYTGSSYLLPGLLGLVLDPYTALRIGCLAAALLAAVALRVGLAQVGASAPAALLATAAFQLAPFGIVDLQRRGAYPEWLALQLGAIWWASLVLLLLRPRGRTFATAACAGAAFIAAHPLQTAALGPLVGILLLCTWWDTGARLARLAPVAFAGFASVALSAFYWLPIVACWNSLKLPAGRGVFAGLGVQLLEVFWPWVRGQHGWALQLGAPLALGLLLALVTRNPCGKALHAAALVLGLGSAVLAGSADAVTAHLPWLAYLLRHFQAGYRLLAPATLCATLALALSAGRLALGPRGVVAAVLAMVLHASGYVHPGRPPGGGPKAYAVEAITSAGFEIPNASMYALVGIDYTRLGWTDARDELILDRALPLPRAGRPFAARVQTLPGVELRVLVGQVPVAVASAPGGIFEFDVRPARNYYIKFESSRGPLPLAALRVRPEGDREWISLPTRVLRQPLDHPGWKALVHSAAEGLVQLPIARQPWDRAYVDGRSAEHASRDAYLWVLRLPAGASSVRVESQRWPPASGLAWLGVLVTLAGAWWQRVRATSAPPGSPH